MHLDRRQARRFRVERPVTVSILGRGKHRALESAALRDIGERGARLALGEPLDAGTRLRIDVRFPGSNGATNIRFEGWVIRVGGGPGYEVAVRFQCGGRFVRRKPARWFEVAAIQAHIA